jgi:hypothetical protein
MNLGGVVQVPHYIEENGALQEFVFGTVETDFEPN